MGPRHCHKTPMDIVLRVVQPAKELALSPAEAETDGRAPAWFDALFREHYPRVVAMLARLTGDRGQAEEIASDAFCKLGGACFSEPNLPWLYRVATNAGLDALRRNARRRQHEQAADGLAYRGLAESLGVQASSIGTLLARAEAEFERKFRVRHGEGI
jgi:DNA-directed RNA polymerase specialized sigma24 family protein